MILPALLFGFSVFLGLCVLLVGFLLFMYLSTKPYPNLHPYASEKFYLDPKLANQKLLFPSIHDPATKDLSIIVPAYNEEERLPQMLNEAIGYLKSRQKSSPLFSYEIIVVDDGSADRTSEVALFYSEKYGTDKVRVLTLEHNRGKGGAIRMGMLSGRGKLMLFADADGATQFSDYELLETELHKINKKNDNLAVVCGSRAHLERESIVKIHMYLTDRKKTRSYTTLLMHGFHFLVSFLCVKGIRDTQCGFKLLTREAALLLFSNLHIERWAFDVDLLYLAKCFNMAVSEIAVNWQEIDGSKLIPFWSWLQMGRDLLLIWLWYFIGAWKINLKPKSD